MRLRTEKRKSRRMKIKMSIGLSEFVEKKEEKEKKKRMVECA